MSVFGAPLALTDVSIFGADRGTSVGFFFWMIGTWSVAARYAFKPFTFTPQAHRVMAPVGSSTGALDPAGAQADGRSPGGGRRLSSSGPTIRGSSGRLRHPD